MWVIKFIDPETIAVINRHYKELSISLLFHYHCVKVFHDVLESIDSLPTFRNDVNKLAFGFHMS